MKRFLLVLALCLPAVSQAQIVLTEDTAYTTIAVNSVPLVDPTDGVTVEEAVAYNATGMDLQWNFIAQSTGAKTTTPVTPTTAGVYDWSHQDGGMYIIEMPASGGASANNDTVGWGWFTGVCDDCAPFCGPTYYFSSNGRQEVDAVLIDGALVSSSLATAADIADAVWDEVTSGHTTAGTFGKLVSDIYTSMLKLGTTYDWTTDQGTKATTISEQ